MNTAKKLCTASILVEHTGHPFSMQKVYNLWVLCMKIWVYRHIVWVANQVMLLQRFKFHQFQLKTNHTAWMKRHAHNCFIRSFIILALDGGAVVGDILSCPANDLSSH